MAMFHPDKFWTASGKKDLSLLERELSFAPYAETHRPPQDEKVCRETVQDYRTRQSVTRAFIAPALTFV
jgi:hypothetical protein